MFSVGEIHESSAQKQEPDTTPIQETTQAPQNTETPEHTVHTGRWGSGEESHWYEYTYGCVNNDIAQLHYDHDNDGLCDVCAYMVGVKQYYSLMISAPEWLYEELRHTYYEGETVSVKISMATDVGFLFFVNGKEITKYQYDSGLYWEFTFTMPACDTVIQYFDGNRIVALCPNNKFYTLAEAYENGYLTLEEIQIIANMHNNGLC